MPTVFERRGVEKLWVPALPADTGRMSRPKEGVQSNVQAEEALGLFQDDDSWGQQSPRLSGH